MPMHEVDDDRYEAIDGDLERDRETVIGLWRGSIGWQDQLDRMYDVFYRNSPFGRGRIKLLRHRPSGEIVGTLGIGPRPMLWQGREVTGGVVSHLTIHRQHRTLRPAAKLIGAMASTARETFPLAYGLTTAAGAVAGRRAGFGQPMKMPRRVKLLRFHAFAERVVPGVAGRAAGALLDGAVAAGRTLRSPLRRTHLHAEWTAEVDPRMQTLWEQSARSEVLQTRRTTSLLSWRFLGLPAIDRRFLLMAPARGAPLVAWFVCETNVRTPAFMTVTDAWFAAGVEGAQREPIQQLCDMAYAAGYAAIEVRLAVAQPVVDAWAAEGFAVHGEQPLFVDGTDLRRPDGSLALHLTDIEQDG